jgi:energy-coupling factor transporter transmembrane protein EcfT
LSGDAGGSKEGDPVEFVDSVDSETKVALVASCSLRMVTSALASRKALNGSAWNENGQTSKIISQSLTLLF